MKDKMNHKKQTTLVGLFGLFLLMNIVGIGYASETTLDWQVSPGDDFEWVYEDISLGIKYSKIEDISLESITVESSQFEVLKGKVSETEYKSTEWMEIGVQTIVSLNVSAIYYNYEKIIPLNITAQMLKDRWDQSIRLQYSLAADELTSTVETTLRYSASFESDNDIFTIWVIYNEQGVLEMHSVQKDSEFESREFLINDDYNPPEENKIDGMGLLPLGLSIGITFILLSRFMGRKISSRDKL